MDPQNELIVARLHRILDCFLEPNFVTTNNVYIEQLLSHLSAKENAALLQGPFAVGWADRCITRLEENFNGMDVKVTAFLFNICSLFALNEWTLLRIREYKIMDRLMALVAAHTTDFTPSMKLGIIRVIASISRFSFGMAYVRANPQTWRCLIGYCNNDHTLYVIREARELIYEIIYKFSVKTQDDAIVVEMLTEILRPLLDNVFDENMKTIHIDVDDDEMQHKISATLELIKFLLQKTLESKEKTRLAEICQKNFNLELAIWKCIETTYNSQNVEKILAALTAFNFSRLVDDKEVDGRIASEDFNCFGLLFFNLMKFCIARADCLNVLKIARLNHILWKQLGDRAPQEIQVENERVRFENQLIVLHIMPLLLTLKSKEVVTEEVFDIYVMKIFHISCMQTMRLCYSYRDVLSNAERTSPLLMVDLACKSIHGILSMGSKLDREQAIVVFQAMIYALKEFLLKTHPHLSASGSSSGNCNSSGDSVNVITSNVELPSAVLHGALVGLQTLIERYRISWKDSLETICLVNLVGLLLETPNLTTRLVVQALKLMQLSIEHFLSPNMALLVDNLHGSGLSCVGPILLKRFHDIAWEVRDSALELTTSMADISRLKFPAFQLYLANLKICPIVYQMAQNDCEPYVRASAFKCLTKFVVLPPIWDNDLSKLDVVEHLFHVLHNETEGIVRQEAVDTLSKLYDQRKVLNAQKNSLYSTLAHSAVNDLHWEVKVHALRFWEQEIYRQFSNQGMIDGTFPTVTFSKEHKKIVTLTAREINVCIMKAFNELSQRGCLGVVLSCLKDDCDLEVIKTAVRIVHRLLEMLSKYDYESAIEVTSLENVPSTSSRSTTTTKNNNVDDQKVSSEIEEADNKDNMSNIISSAPVMDDVIESILDAQDINLLIAACERQLHLNSSSDDTDKRPNDDFSKVFASVTAKDFINSVREMNLDQLLKKHQEWSLCDESFISLLDDIICTIAPEEVVEPIFADCY